MTSKVQRIEGIVRYAHVRSNNKNIRNLNGDNKGGIVCSQWHAWGGACWRHCTPKAGHFLHMEWHGLRNPHSKPNAMIRFIISYWHSNRNGIWFQKKLMCVIYNMGDGSVCDFSKLRSWKCGVKSCLNKSSFVVWFFLLKFQLGFSVSLKVRVFLYDKKMSL